jgi:hypothetical protein
MKIKVIVHSYLMVVADLFALLIASYVGWFCLSMKIKVVVHSYLMVVADLFALLIASYVGWF